MYCTPYCSHETINVKLMLFNVTIYVESENIN